MCNMLNSKHFDSAVTHKFMRKSTKLDSAKDMNNTRGKTNYDQFAKLENVAANISSCIRFHPGHRKAKTYTFS